MIPLGDPRRLLALMGTEVLDHLTDVIERGVFTPDVEVRNLEGEFAEWIGLDNVIASGSGSASLEAALHSLEIGHGDVVATTSILDISAVGPVSHVGATPMWVDLEPGTSAMSAEQLESTWNPATKAVLIVHAHGYPTDVGEIVPIAHERGAAVIEDITHAPGAWSGGQRVGSIGDVMVMSCSPTKPLGAVGNAGLAATDSSDLAGAMREYLSYGFKNESLKAVHAGAPGAEFDYATVGINGMPDEIQAAVLRRKLIRLDEWADLRRKQLSVYEGSLRNVPGVRMVQGQGQQRSAPRHLIANVGANRDAILGLLRDRGVGATAGYYPGLHSQDVYADLARAPLPAARDFEQSIVALPIGPELTSGEIEASVEALCRVVATL